MNWLHTALLIVHVLGAGLIVSLGVFSVIIQSKKPSVAEQVKLLGDLWKKASWVFGAQILTGFYLAGTEWGEFSKNPILWVKLGLIIVVSGIGAVISKQSAKKQAGNGNGPSPLLPWLVLVIYLVIVSLGVILAEIVG